MRRTRARFAWALAAPWLLCGAARGDAQGKLGDVSWSLFGEVRLRPEWRNNADLDRSLDDDRREGFLRSRLGLALSVQEDYRIVFQIQDARVAGEETSTASNERNLDLHQGFVELKRLGIDGLSLSAGRQEWAYGDQRLIGNFGWNNVGRSFDGARLRWARQGYFADAFYARITSRIVQSATHGSDLYGIYTQCACRKGSEYEAYGLVFADPTSAAGEAGPPGTTRVSAVGTRLKDRFGPLDVSLEMVFERGHFHGDTLSAHAGGAQAGIVWSEKVKVRTFGGYDYASGDRDPSDGKQNEFFNFFPTNHPLYGYADYEGWRNLRSPYGGASLTSGRHFVQAKLHRFALQNARGPWKDATGTVFGFDPSGAAGRSVGREFDATYRFNWKEKATIEAGYSRFQPGRFARAARADDSSDWGYVQLSLGF